MPLYGKTLAEILAESLTELSTNTNLTRLGPGGKARAILEAVSKRLEEAYTTFDLNLARAFLSTAPGQYLKLIGDLLGLPSEPSVAASASADLQNVKFYVDTGTFSTINSGGDISLSRGTIISSEPNDAGVLYRLTSDTTLLAGQSSGWVSVEATSPGSNYNIGSGVLRYHSFSGYTDYLNSSLKVTNIYPIANGKNFESDTNYRYRLSKRVLEAEAANETAIRLAALSAPGVADVILVPRYRGIGTFGIIIKSVGPVVNSSLIDVVTAKVLSVQGYGSIAYIKGPKEIGFACKINIYYDKQMTTTDLSLLEANMIESVTTNVNSLDIGDSLYVGKLTASLYPFSTNILNIGEAGKPLAESYIYRSTRLEDNRIRQQLLGDYITASDERVIVEPSISNAITFASYFSRR